LTPNANLTAISATWLTAISLKLPKRRGQNCWRRGLGWPGAGAFRVWGRWRIKSTHTFTREQAGERWPHDLPGAGQDTGWWHGPNQKRPLAAFDM